MRKRIAFYWDDSPMPWLRYITIASFQCLNPGWDIVLLGGAQCSGKTWNTPEAHSEYTGYDWREKLSDVESRDFSIPDMSPQQVGDMCRWSCLSDGMMFSDMDIVYFNEIVDIYGVDGLSCNRGILKLGLTTGVKNGIFGKIYQEAIKRYDRGRYQSCGVETLYSLAFNETIGDVDKYASMDTFEKLKSSLGADICNIPMSTVHQLEPPDIHTHKLINQKSSGLHWYGGHPDSNEIARLATHLNYKKLTHDMSIAEALDKLPILGDGTIERN